MAEWQRKDKDKTKKEIQSTTQRDTLFYIVVSDQDKSRIKNILSKKEKRRKNALASHECSIPAALKDHLLHAETQDALSKNNFGKLTIDIGYCIYFTPFPCQGTDLTLQMHKLKC